MNEKINMNKFGLIVSLALVCLVKAGEAELEEKSEGALNPSDDEELAGLSGKHQIFSDFCIKSRDYVVEDLQNLANRKAADVFTLFFRSAEEMGLDTLNTQKEATERLAEQLRNPETPLSDSGDLIEEGRRQIQESGNNIPKSLFQAITSALTATGTTVAQGVKARLMKIRGALGLDTAISILTETCSKIEQYEQELREKFTEQMVTIAEKDPTMSNLRLDQVECLTSKRIIKIDGLCKFAKIAKQPLMKIFTHRS